MSTKLVFGFERAMAAQVEVLRAQRDDYIARRTRAQASAAAITELTGIYTVSRPDEILHVPRLRPNCINCGAPPTRAGHCLYCLTERA
jgi:hypothetical protein